MRRRTMFPAFLLAAATSRIPMLLGAAGLGCGAADDGSGELGAATSAASTAGPVKMGVNSSGAVQFKTATPRSTKKERRSANGTPRWS